LAKNLKKVFWIIIISILTSLILAFTFPSVKDLLLVVIGGLITVLASIIIKSIEINRESAIFNRNNIYDPLHENITDIIDSLNLFKNPFSPKIYFRSYNDMNEVIKTHIPKDTDELIKMFHRIAPEYYQKYHDFFIVLEQIIGNILFQICKDSDEPIQDGIVGYSIKNEIVNAIPFDHPIENGLGGIDRSYKEAIKEIIRILTFDENLQKILLDQSPETFYIVNKSSDPRKDIIEVLKKHKFFEVLSHEINENSTYKELKTLRDKLIKSATNLKDNLKAKIQTIDKNYEPPSI
jgi:hypothetical protein